MSDGLTVPPNWTRDDPDWEEDAGRKYDPRAVVEYAHLDQPLRLVLAPARVPAAVADDERGYRVDIRYGSVDTSLETYEIAAVPSLADAHAVAADFMRLYTEFGAGGDHVARVIEDIARTKEDAWTDAHDAVTGDITEPALA
ncbi:hypothetical protein MBEHAL_1589 [Halarchaeum acidiphilum MH1-52-1]|uniref:Uncharacterized protein n=1 Tax=Halarchaeum acidiphilum MH1-52-1 TaxID=1261545 RepID=U3A5C9_9EURY|nr:hypothetical protein [Halarchaeum acidiphilum]GAD52829.1 hypothetical protein MBEHAL_1589 [Halarchaeum acidiphilum MH1-52-1]